MNLASPGILGEIVRSGSVQHIDEIPEKMRRRFAIAQEIPAEWHVRMQAAFQKHSDNAVSKTVNLPFSASPADVEAVYRLAYHLECKGITVFRDRCRESQVLNVGCAACALDDLEQLSFPITAGRSEEHTPQTSGLEA